jgi:hypothetical protein
MSEFLSEKIHFELFFGYFDSLKSILVINRKPDQSYKDLKPKFDENL